MKKTQNIICLMLVFLGLAVPGYSRVIYVAPVGDDADPGTLSQPIASVQKAQSLASPGDTVYFRGGTYLLAGSDISRVYSNLFACYAFLDKSGTAGNTIKYWAFPGEQPVFDLNAVKPANQRVVGFYITASYLHLRGLEITGVQVSITGHTESYCIYNYGSYNTFERLSFHDNQGTGLRHRRGGHNLFLNCDSYRNHDYTSENGLGGNTDGFGCHPDEGGTGNVFRGCRAWFNSDDGFDFIGSAEAVRIENCWSMYNGYSTDFSRLADGNGFKAGGDAVTPVDQLPDPIPRHVVQFCLAVRNKANGFYANHHIGGITWYNNTAFRNSTNFNMLNRLDDNATDVPGYGHIMRNNLGFRGGNELGNINKAECDLSHNYFDLEVEVSEDDFLSLDENLLTGPRQEDGSLPETDFMRLAPGSDLIDAGTDIGFPYSGTAPDLGAFEKDYYAFPAANAGWSQYYYPEFYWEPENRPYYLVYGLLDRDTLIGGKEYHKLFRFGDDSMDPDNATCIGALREDASKRVWFRGEHPFADPVSDTGDIMLYDFSLSAGDTVREGLFLPFDYLVVSAIDTFSIGGGLRKKIEFENCPYTSWIEGVGNEAGLLFYTGNLTNNGLYSELVCFWQDGELMFHHARYENCFQGSSDFVPFPGKGNNISIFPNPVKNVLIIELDHSGGFTIDMSNLQGQTVYCRELTGQDGQINMDSFSKGVYLISVRTRDQLWTQKILKL